MAEAETFPTSELGVRVRTAVLWQFLARGLSMGVQTLASIALARLLMPADFGIVALALMVNGLAGIFQDLGLGQALVQREKITSEHLQAAFWGTLGMGVILCLGLILAAPPLSLYFHEPRLTAVLRVLALTFILSPWAVVPRSLLQRQLDFRTPFWASLASALTYALVGILGALLGYRYWSLVGASLASTGTNSFMLCWLTRYRPPLRPAWKRLADLISFGMGATAVGLLGYLASQADYFVIGRWLDTTALGLYQRAYNLIATPLFIPWALFGVFFSAFSRLQNEREQLRDGFSRLLTMTALLTWPVYALLWTTAPEFVPLVFGSQWQGAVVPLQILVLVGLLRILNDTSRGAIRALGTPYVWRDAWRLLVYALAIGGGAGLVLRWGIEGVAWAVTGATVLLFLLLLQLLYNGFGFGGRDWLRVLRAPLLASGGTGLAAWTGRLALAHMGASPWLMLLGAIGSGFVIGALLLWLPLRDFQLVRRELAFLRQRILLTTPCGEEQHSHTNSVRERDDPSTKEVSPFSDK